jgi:hypothetical protein
VALFNRLESEQLNKLVSLKIMKRFKQFESNEEVQHSMFLPSQKEFFAQGMPILDKDKDYNFWVEC